MSDITIRISSRTLKILGCILVAICVIWLGQYGWAKGFLLPKYELKAFIPAASGVEEGATVSLDGIEVGTVKAVKLAGQPASNDRRIELDLRIFKKYQGLIRTDSVAMLETQGLLGKRFVHITRGFNGAPIEAGGEISVRAVPVATSNLTDLLDRIGTCMKEQKSSSTDPANVSAK
jgi:ABC-type transporter Mla subunit MlaD